MSNEDISVVDFESEKIESRPAYPPKPVGVAIRWPGGKKEYLSWGHPDGNNCDISTARAKLKDAYSAKRVLFHHAAFDMDIAESYFGLKPPKRYDDTLFLAFLDNPYEQRLGLKELASSKCEMPPEEQDDLREWIQTNIPEAKRAKTKWGEYIARAPAELTGKYAIGDVDRTYALYEHYMPKIEKRGMRAAYERELRCVPLTLEMERSGVRIDRKRLSKCQDVFMRMDRDMLHGIAKKLRINPKDLKSDDNKKGFNLNSGKQLGDALVRAGKLDIMRRTASGQISTKIEVLRTTCNDKDLLNMMAVHSVAEKYLSTFIAPWLEQSAISGGRILPKFNQVRGYDEGGGGARSGRYSSSDPNMQNISANVEESQNRETLELMQGWLKNDYHYPFIGLRDFILPDEDTVMICVDYNQQEIRILAHFENGVLAKAYRKTPDLDIHTYCQQLVKQAIGIEFPRKHIKVTVFGLIYGMGIDKLAKRLEIDNDVAAKVRKGILTAIPGIKHLIDDLKRMANHNKPLTTWGGREYFCEEPRFDHKTGRWRSFEYKMLNYLIQPSAADCTKQGMINVDERVPEARIAIQVHDELVCMAPSRDYGPRIAEAMCDVDMNVPMLADPKYSTQSWARAAK